MVWTTVLVTAVGTLVILAVFGFVVYRRLRSVVAEVTVLYDEVMPDVERLQRDVAMLTEELERIAERTAGDD